MLLLFGIVTISNAQNAADKDLSFNSFALPTNTYYVSGEVFKTLVGPDNKLYLLEKGIEGKDKIVKLNNNTKEGVSDLGDDAIIFDFLIQPDGKFIVSGIFQIDNSPYSVKVLRLNADFSIDYNFSNSVPLISSGNLRLLLQPDGKIILFGYLSVTQNSIITTKNAIRLNGNGTIDNAFNYFSNLNFHKVDCFALQPDGKILIATQISEANYNGRRVQRLNADGSLDPSFLLATGGNTAISKIITMPDGRILVGGSFGYYNENFGATKKIVMLLPNGEVDTSFNSVGPEYGRGLDFYPYSLNNIAFVSDMIKQQDGKIIIVGFFNSFNTTPGNPSNCANIIRLNSDGSRDANYTPSISRNLSQIGATLNRLALDANGNLFIGGLFNKLNNQIVNNIVKVNNQGNLVPDFNNICRGFDGSVHMVREFSNGKILVFGNFDKYNGITAKRLVRLNADGSMDMGFNAMFDENFLELNYNDIKEIIIQPDNKILILGYKNPNFSYSNIPFNGILRLNENGTIDNSFNVGEGFNHPLPSSWANPMSMALQPDGKIIVSGAIGMYKGTTTGNVIRILSNGDLDTAFSTTTAVRASHIFVEPNGKIIVSSLVQGITEKLNNDGTLNFAFLNDLQPLIGVQSDGKYLVRPLVNSQYLIKRVFSDGVTVDPSYSSFSVPMYYQLNNFELQANNKLLMSYPENRIVRVNSNGQLDSTFNMQNGFSTTNDAPSIFNTKTLSTGKIMVASPYGEMFYEYDNTAEWNIVRLIGGDSTLSTGDYTNAKSQIKLYPNPSESIINLEYSESIAIKKASIFNLMGQEVITIPNSEKIKSVDISKLSNGYYFLSLQTDIGVRNAGFIKQ